MDVAITRRYLKALWVLVLAGFAYITPLQAATWPAYPADLPKFEYNAETLEQNWVVLTKVTQQPFPNAENIQNQLVNYPKLLSRLQTQAKQANAHPALKAVANDDYVPLAKAIQQAWQLHFSGQFEAAYQLGKQLGTVGLMPALYARLMHNTLIEKNKEKRVDIYREISSEIENALEMAPNFDFAQFGLAYAHAREMELLSVAEATSTGYLTEVRDALKKLAKRYPQRSLYPAMLGGMHAGVVEKVGSFVGRMTYGMSEKGAKKAFKRAFELETELPVIYYEYAKALERIDEDDYKKQIKQALNTCQNLQVFSAEEALNQRACSDMLKSKRYRK